MRRLCAEALGTFGLVFAGTGAIVINEARNGAVTHLGIALTFGLSVLAMIYTFGDISVAHLNPAVTIGFWTARRLPGRDVLPYIVSQCLGAFLASAVLRLLFPQSRLLGATMPAGSELQSFMLEALLTLFLMLTILSVCRRVNFSHGRRVGHAAYGNSDYEKESSVHLHPQQRPQPDGRGFFESHLRRAIRSAQRRARTR